MIFFLALLAALVLPDRASATSDPDHVTFTLEGCRNDGTITLPNANGKYICPNADYTTGNLGKGWNELDLVPHRLTVQAGHSAPATQTYAISVVLDREDVTRPGYDVLSAPVLNAARSSASCTAATIGAQTVLDPGLGGIDKSIYRLVTITQAADTTCVYDFYGRLALGSHLFPGSSLHANLANQAQGTAGVGSREVSIPVKEILPQTIDKTMTARQDASQTWGVSKTGPTSADFGDVCAAGGPQPQSVQITVQWTKLEATPGNITAMATISATNPAARTITVAVTDKVYAGPSGTPGAALHTSTFPAVDVPAATTMVVATDTVTLPSNATTPGGYLNDVATATYTDLATGVAVPGNTIAMAEAQLQPGNVTNTSATVSDVESIAGPGLAYAVAQPLSGAFDGYVAGTATTGDVKWNSDAQSDSGSITFTKTLTLDGPRVTSGTLSDTATLTASDGFGATSNTLDIGITSSASVQLTVTKTIPDFLDPGQRLEVEFHVARTGDTTYSKDFTLTFLGGGATSASTTLKGLVPDTYSVTEGTVTFYPADYPASPVLHPALVPLQGNTQTKDLTVQDGSGAPYAHCSGSVQFDNAVPTTAVATARVQKLTDPVLQQGDPAFFWSFSLIGPDGTPVESLTDAVGANQGFVAFATPLTSSGTWTVVETPRSNWDLDTATPNDGSQTKVCSLAVDLIFDEGKTFDCTFHNTKRGRAALIKTVSGAAPSGAQSYTFQLRTGATPTDTGDIVETRNATANNGGTFNFTTTLIPGQSYQLCEIVMPGWQTNLGTLVPGLFLPPDGVAINPNVDNSIVCASFTVSAGETRTFRVDNTPPPGGRALTIGYWKNWASCTKSATKKMNTLDLTLASFPIASGQTTHGLFVGTLYVDTCPEAVALLNKSTLSGKKSASDPAFNMAAQLMAARLNVQAGAGVCPAAAAAITLAQALLAQHAFNGETHSAINGTNKLLMNNTAETLDRYNNNVLCGP